MTDQVHDHFLANWYQANVEEYFWWSVNIGSDNGLMLAGNKPLPEAILTMVHYAGSDNGMVLSDNKPVPEAMLTMFR